MTVSCLRWIALGLVLTGLGLTPAVDAAGTSRGLTVPLKATVSVGKAVALESTCSVAERAPAAEGMNLTDAVQLPAWGTSGSVQFTNSKSLALVPVKLPL